MIDYIDKFSQAVIAKQLQQEIMAGAHKKQNSLYNRIAAYTCAIDLYTLNVNRGELSLHNGDIDIRHIEVMIQYGKTDERDKYITAVKDGRCYAQDFIFAMFLGEKPIYGGLVNSGTVLEPNWGLHT